MDRAFVLACVSIGVAAQTPCALAPNGKMLCCPPDDTECLAKIQTARSDDVSQPPALVTETPHPSMLGAVSTFANASIWDRASAYDVAVVGVPFGLNAGYEAPGLQLVRREVSRIPPFSRLYSKAFTDLNVVDGQDMLVSGKDRVKALVKAALPFFKTGKPLVVLGGDQSISVPLMTAAKSALGQFAVIHIDKDLAIGSGRREQDLDESTAMFWAAAQSLFDTRHSLHLGVRGNLQSQRVQLVDEELGFQSITADDVALEGVREVVARIKSRLKRRDGTFMPAYISLDLDVLDPAAYLESGEVGGLSVGELRAILGGLRDFCYVVGAEIRDVAQLSNPGAVKVAASIAHDLVLLAGIRSMSHDIVAPNLKSQEL